MKPEEQRIAIAKACGYETDGELAWTPPLTNTDDDVFRILPDYLNDLNAMHEAEKVLTEQQAKEYRWKLQQGFLPNTQVAQELLCHATATQRAEAFLKVLGKWKE